MKYFILMIQFFTRIPIRINVLAEEKDFSKGLPYFPLVGLVIGIFNYLVFFIFSYLGEGLLPIVFWLLANIVVTGAIHIDGLADTCDGLLSSRSKERMLEIMKDSRIGTNGVIAIAMDLLTRLTFMFSLSLSIRPFVIILSPIVGKSFALMLIWISSYARKNGGMGGLFYNDMSKLHVILGLLSGALMVSLIYSWKLLLVLIPCLIFILIYRRFVINKIDGMTGDTLGAANELAEICFMGFICVFERLGYL